MPPSLICAVNLSLFRSLRAIVGPQNSVDLGTCLVALSIEDCRPACYDEKAMAVDHNQVSTRIIQEYVPGRQVTIAHIIANPDKSLCQRVGLEDAAAIGMMTLTPGESAIIAGDLALKAADVTIGFLDRFSGTLVITGSLVSVQTAVDTANRGLETILGFYPARVTRS
jgi:ethanolamine utilization protein EutS